MPLEFTTSYVADSLAVFRQYKRLAERALEQVNDEQFVATIDSESNSLALILKHMIGNMRSRWTDFLISDGEKPWRNRDSEFELGDASRTDLMQQWEAAWMLVFSALEPLGDADLERVVTIRGEKHSVMQAINRQIAHYAYHVGQVVFLAKHLKGSEFKSLTIPKRKSLEFNAKVAAGEASQR
jgi:uncharacterized damage-inducible protein DinB